MDDAPGANPLRGYEFGPREDAVIGRTARWVTWWGWIAIAAGILMIVGGLMSLHTGGVAQLIMGGVYILIGVFFRAAGKALGRVVETSGDDVAHLMEALGSLTSAFKVQVILVVVGVVLALATAVIVAAQGG